MVYILVLNIPKLKYFCRFLLILVCFSIFRQIFAYLKHEIIMDTAPDINTVYAAIYTLNNVPHESHKASMWLDELTQTVCCFVLQFYVVGLFISSHFCAIFC